MARPLARSSRAARVRPAPPGDRELSSRSALAGLAALKPPLALPPAAPPAEARDSLLEGASAAAMFGAAAQRLLSLLAGLASCPACEERPAGRSGGVCSDCSQYLRRAVAALPAPGGDDIWLGPYAGVWRRLVHALKYRGSRRTSELLGELLAIRLAASGYRAQLVAHVPTTAGRRRQRGYDQAELLALALARGSALPHVNALVRTRTTAKQAGRGREARSVNVAGAFRSRYLAGRRLILVDDVLTTGATLAAARAALLAAGASEVRCAVVAKAARHDAAQQPTVLDDAEPGLIPGLEHDRYGAADP